MSEELIKRLRLKAEVLAGLRDATASLLTQAADALSRPAPAVQVPEGMALVPVEPTDAMAVAAIKASIRNPAINGVHIYRAMLAAAPAAPVATEDVAQEDDVTLAYDAGFRRACDWARRDDMLHDLESFAYKQDRACDLDRIGIAVATEAVAQGGGVDEAALESAANLLQECIVQNGGKPSEMAIDWARKIAALLSASPAGVGGWIPVFEVGFGWLTSEHQNRGTLLYAPAIANQEARDA